MTPDTAPAAARGGDLGGPSGALVVGGAHVSIAVARSLGRRGIPVWLLASHPLPRLSRYVRRSFSWPGAEHPDGVSSIVDVAARHGLKGWVLFATGDEDMRLIAQNHALLASHFRVATANWDTIRWVYDKRLTYRRAAALGIDCPRGFQPRDLETVRQSDVQFPVVLKPACRDGINELTKAKAWKADDRDALLALYRRATSLVGNDAVIVQEWIPGNGDTQFSYAGLWDRGKPVASLVARRARQYPVDFGRSSTFVETVEQEQVETLACRFLESLSYSGVVEIEFKYDRRDRRYKLLDVNGRFWTWTGLGQLADVDFPYLAWRQALGQDAPRAPAKTSVKTGVAWMHASRDILAAVAEISRGVLTVSDYLAGLRKEFVFASFAVDDPLPAIAELPLLAWSRLTKRGDGRSGLRGTKEFTDDLAVGGGPSANVGPATQPALGAGLGADVEASIDLRASIDAD
jgi:predicted ATP-grasp superfamily ATP-dependent carboligase